MYVFDWKLRRDPYKYILQSLVAILAIGVILFFLDLRIQTALVASLGATSFTIFTRPRHFMSSFRTVAGGYAVGILVGVLMDLFIRPVFPGEYSLHMAGGLAVGVAIFIMVATNTEHPPAAGISLGLVLNEWNLRTLIFIVSAVVLMLVLKSFLKPYMINLIGEEPSKRPGMKLSSPSFPDGGEIPEKYTCKGDNISPPLKIDSVPEGTEFLALVLADYEGILGVRHYWVLWNIPSDTREIVEGAFASCVCGINDYGKTKYMGPSPSSASHTYVFRLYALDCKLDIPEGSKCIKLERAMSGHILDKATLSFINPA